MTLKELSQLYYLKREIEMDNERLQKLKTMATSTSISDSCDKVNGGTHEKSRLERYVSEIVDLEAIISSKLTQCLHERKRLERYIADIPDSLIRQIFTLRFIDGLSWSNVAYRIGGYNTKDNTKKLCYRYITQENLAK